MRNLHFNPDTQMFSRFKSKVQNGDSNPLINSIRREAERKSLPGEPLDASLLGVEEVPMTVAGAINKTFILTLLMLITAAYGYSNPSMLMIWGGAIGGLVLVLIASFRPGTARWAAPAYALVEGLFVGAVSAIYASQMDGIILQAISLTIAVLLTMLGLYQSGIIKVTQRLRSGIFMATGAVALVYLAAIALSFFGIQMPYLHQGGPIGIGISLVILGIAAFNLLVDFDNIERGAQAGLPSRYEWLFGMGLLITVVWIYLELLRLLSVLNRD